MRNPTFSPFCFPLSFFHYPSFPLDHFRLISFPSSHTPYLASSATLSFLAALRREPLVQDVGVRVQVVIELLKFRQLLGGGVRLG